ncbi:ATP-binding protein [Actinomadura sp. 9N407]|uniref:ATP-binding protein n=1 Tax=Actinomadura sp. 9N407 TaxID=3375154 RepID=UPI00378D6275
MAGNRGGNSMGGEIGVATPDLMREMLATRAAVGLARAYIRQHLCALGLAHTFDDTSLIGSELMTNAIAASATGSTVRLFIGYRCGKLVLAVWDDSPAMPVRKESEPLTPDAVDSLPDEPGGWGLGLVEALAHEYWTEPAGSGKWVCAALKT